MFSCNNELANTCTEHYLQSVVAKSRTHETISLENRTPRVGMFESHLQDSTAGWKLVLFCLKREHLSKLKPWFMFRTSVCAFAFLMEHCSSSCLEKWPLKRTFLSHSFAKDFKHQWCQLLYSQNRFHVYILFNKGLFFCDHAVKTTPPRGDMEAQHFSPGNTITFLFLLFPALLRTYLTIGMFWNDCIPSFSMFICVSFCLSGSFLY